MKPTHLLISLLFLATSLGLAQPPATTSARTRAKQHLAMRAAAQEIIDTIKPDAPIEPERESQLVTELSDAMLQNVTAHTTPKQSLSLCSEHLITSQTNMLNRQIDRILRAANAQSPATISRDEVLTLIAPDWDAHLYVQATAFATRHANALFARARPRSVALQRDQLRLQVPMPTQDALNTQLAEIQQQTGDALPPPTALAPLVAWLVDLASKDTPALFQEVHHSTRDAANRVVQTIRAQYEGQIKLLEATIASLPPSVLLAEAIADHLREALYASSDAKREATHDNALTIYSPFPPILAAAAARAAALESQRLAAVVSTLPVPPLPLGQMATTLQKHPRDHINPDASSTHFATTLLPELHPWYAEAIAEKAELENLQPLLQCLPPLLTTEGPVRRAALSHIQAAMKEELGLVREAMAEVQLTRLLGSLPSSIDSLSPSMVTALTSTFAGVSPDTFDTTWKLLVGIDAIKAPEVKDELIEEARGKLVTWAKSRLSAARKAAASQITALQKLEAEWTPALRDDVAAEKPLEEITAAWTKELTSRWKAAADAAQLPYPALFPYTAELLQKTVRKLFDASRVEINAAATTEPTVSEAETPDEPPEIEPEVKEEPPEEPEPESTEPIAVEELLKTLDFVLYLRDTSAGDSQALLLSDERQPIEMLFDPADPQKAVDSLFLAIQPSLTKAASTKAEEAPEGNAILRIFKRPAPLEMKIAVLVSSREVRHMTGILLRNRVRLFVEDWNADPQNRPIELEWEDNLELVAP